MNNLQNDAKEEMTAQLPGASLMGDAGGSPAVGRNSLHFGHLS